MCDGTRLSVVAGMLHQWDKQLRDWLVQEIRHWHRGDIAVSKSWSVDFLKIADLLDGLGWKIAGENFLPSSTRATWSSMSINMARGSRLMI